MEWELRGDLWEDDGVFVVSLRGIYFTSGNGAVSDRDGDEDKVK